MPTLMVCWYWILKLKARYLSGDYVEALAAAGKAKPLLSALAAQLQLLDYFYYAALTVAACYENASADSSKLQRELLTAHQEQLREWAENYPPTFADKYALVSAEIARLEGRDVDAMRSVRAGHSIGSRDTASSRTRALAHEVAARFYAGARLRDIRPHVSTQRAELLRPLGRARQGEATRRTLPALARGTASCFHHRHHRHAGRAVGRRDCTSRPHRHSPARLSFPS